MSIFSKKKPSVNRPAVTPEPVPLAALRHDLLSKDPIAAIRATKDLASRGGEGIEALGSVLSEIKDKSVAEAAAHALQPVDGFAATKFLILGLQNTEWEARTIFRDTLGKIDPGWRTSDAVRAAVPVLMEALSSKDHSWRAAQALGEIRASVAVPSLIHMLSSDDRSQRHRAAGALGNIRDAAAINPLLTMIKQRGDRDMAVEVLARIDPGWMIRPEAKSVLPYLIEELSDCLQLKYGKTGAIRYKGLLDRMDPHWLRTSSTDQLLASLVLAYNLALYPQYGDFRVIDEEICGLCEEVLQALGRRDAIDHLRPAKRAIQWLDESCPGRPIRLQARTEKSLSSQGIPDVESLLAALNITRVTRSRIEITAVRSLRATPWPDSNVDSTVLIELARGRFDQFDTSRAGAVPRLSTLIKTKRAALHVRCLAAERLFAVERSALSPLAANLLLDCVAGFNHSCIEFSGYEELLTDLKTEARISAELFNLVHMTLNYTVEMSTSGIDNASTEYGTAALRKLCQIVDPLSTAALTLVATMSNVEAPIEGDGGLRIDRVDYEERRRIASEELRRRAA